MSKSRRKKSATHRNKGGSKKPIKVKGAQLLVGNYNVFVTRSGTNITYGKAYVENTFRGNSPDGTIEHFALITTIAPPAIGESLVLTYVDNRQSLTELNNFKGYARDKKYIEATCVPRTAVDTK